MKLKLKRSNGLDTIRHRDNRLKRVLYTVIQIILCTLLISIAFIVSTNGFYIKPLLLIPIAICLATFSEDELQSSLIGAVCGLLLDIAYDKLLGFNGAILMVMCVFTTIMFKNYFKPVFFNALMYVSIFTLIHGLLDYFFYYKVWVLTSKEDVFSIYDSYIFPTCIMTILSTIIIYPIVRAIRVELKA